MKLVSWMAGGSLLSSLAATALLGTRSGVEIFLGMAGPLAVASGTWVAIERTHRLHPERVTSLMIAAFGGKMVFFGAYVVAVLSVRSLRPVPFVVSFTSYFIGLHLVEALSLRRLFLAGGGSAGSG
jgi:hypothetical protein